MPEPADQVDPVQAYDEVAPYYVRISAQRQPYLAAIESLIAARIPSGSLSLLDVGAGCGSRTLRIAERAKVNKVVILEPSREMSRMIPPQAEVWNIRAEELGAQFPPARGRHFDVITCLWNVLGHIRPEENRIRVLRELKHLLAPGGLLFLDVNHRYNAAAYGWTMTIGRYLRDQVFRNGRSGDVTVTWRFDGFSCSTYGHVFTNRQVRMLAKKAGLEMEEQIVVDYQNGDQRRHGYQGNLLYVFRPAILDRESSSVEQTSSISASVS